MLRQFCVKAQERNIKLEYRGESQAAVGKQFVETYFTKPRTFLHATEKERLLLEQNRECAICGDELGEKCQADHKVPLCEGGHSAPDQLLCKPCHAKKSREEELCRGLPHHVLASQLNATAMETFLSDPPPPELSHGQGTPKDAVITDEDNAPFTP